MSNHNPLIELESLGQSVWIDFIRRGMIESGQLKELICRDGVSGVTSNPAIFEKAISGSHDYQTSLRALALENKSAEEIYLSLAIEDIQGAADELRSVYDRTGGRDGFVSLEVSPRLARDTSGTIREARKLWKRLDRPNVMIKVPALPEGIPAIRELISEGLNINVTLLFSLSRYREVVDAYLTGLEMRAHRGEPIDRISSVASFFLSRIDRLVDERLEKVGRQGDEWLEADLELRGQAAIALAKLAYRIYRESFSSERFRALEKCGGNRQRLLWASTSTKDRSYSDVKYIEALIGPETINTMPVATLNAYRDHGRPAPRLERGIKEEEDRLKDLVQLGIDFDDTGRTLEDEGVRKFLEPFEKLLKELSTRAEQAIRDKQTGNAA